MQVQSVSTKTNVLQQDTMYKVLFAISFVHLVNDTIQGVIPNLYPILQKSMNLSYVELGLITFTVNMTASVMQPVIGLFTDKRPAPFLLPLGMFSTLLGMVLLAFAPNLWMILVAVTLIGLGSAVFHPEGSRVANMAAGQKRGLSQSIFQVGGNGGQALAPLLIILFIIPLGQFGSIWFSVLAGIAMLVLFYVAKWYQEQLKVREVPRKRGEVSAASAAKLAQRKKQITIAMFLLVFIVFARSWYYAGMTSFFHLYLIDKFKLPLENAQFFLFLFLGAGAVGTFFGGPLADRFGKKNMIIFSLLGSLPFALLLPFANQFWSYFLVIIIGFIMLSSFSVSVVYAQDLMPGRVGMASGMIVGLAFGMGGIGSIVQGKLADLYGLEFVMIFCGFLPLLGLLSFFLPGDKKLVEWGNEA